MNNIGKVHSCLELGKGLIGRKNGTFEFDEQFRIDFETILAEIEKKDKEIEKLKKKNRELLRKLRNRVKEVKKLEKYSLYKEEFKTLNKRLEKKDKIINLAVQDLIACGGLDFIDIGKSNGNFIEDKQKLKQYFERKVEE